MSLLWWRGRTNKPAFRDRVSAALRESLPGATIEAIGDLEIRVSGLTNGKTLNLWLGRAYADFCERPTEADQIVARHVRGAVTSMDDLPVDLDHIFPSIKPGDWLLSQTAQHSGQGGRFEPWI